MDDDQLLVTDVTWRCPRCDGLIPADDIDGTWIPRVHECTAQAEFLPLTWVGETDLT